MALVTDRTQHQCGGDSPFLPCRLSANRTYSGPRASTQATVASSYHAAAVLVGSSGPAVEPLTSGHTDARGGSRLVDGFLLTRPRPLGLRTGRPGSPAWQRL